MSISLREFIRWLPEDASEPTSTIVVTSPGRRFVDIRALLPEGATPSTWPTKEERITLDQLDWAIAGTSKSWPIGDDGTDLTRGQWRHWIDSRSKDTDGVFDEGDNYPQPDGKTLEKGSMVNPATGKDTAYEELWRSGEPVLVNSIGVRSVVLKLEKGDQIKGSVVLVGQYCQGFMRKGDGITAERWEWTGRDGWRRTIVLGEDELPCSKLLEDTAVTLGQVITIGDVKWEVIEVSES